MFLFRRKKNVENLPASQPASPLDSFLSQVGRGIAEWALGEEIESTIASGNAEAIIGLVDAMVIALIAAAAVSPQGEEERKLAQMLVKFGGRLYEEQQKRNNPSFDQIVDTVQARLRGNPALMAVMMPYLP